MEYKHPVSGGKVGEPEKKAERMKLDVVGVSEVRWTGCGQLTSGGWTLYYSGGETHYAGVGVLLRKEVAEAVIGCWQVSERVILVKIDARPIGLNGGCMRQREIIVMMRWMTSMNKWIVSGVGANQK